MPLTTTDLNDIRTVVLDALDAVVSPRLDLLEKQMVVLQSQMGNLEIRMGGLEDRMGGLEIRVGGVETKVDGLESRMGGLEGTMQSYQYENSRRLTTIETKLEDMDGRLITLHNDVMAIYEIIGELQHQVITDKAFRKLPDDKKLLTIHAEVMSLGRRLNVALPRS